MITAGHPPINQVKVIEKALKEGLIEKRKFVSLKD